MLQVIISIFIMVSCRPQSHTILPSTSQHVLPTNQLLPPNLHLFGDSGYVQARWALPFIRYHVMQDKTLAPGDNEVDEDTLGKFYKNDAGSYTLCLRNSMGEEDRRSHHLFEIRQTTLCSRVLRYRCYEHGNRPDCWQNAYEGFQKIGDYFSFKGCITGSCFTGTKTYVFRTLDDFSDLNPIPTAIFECGDEVHFRRIQSRLIPFDSLLIAHYEETTGDILYKRGSAIYPAQKTVRFTISYVLCNNGWTMQDSSYAGKLEM